MQGGEKMKELYVDGVNTHYRIYIDTSIDKFVSALIENKIKTTDSLFIITDSNVYKIYEKRIRELLKNYKVKIFYINAGEENKNIVSVDSIYSFLIKNDANRDSVLIALGGGVVGDIAGFAAATYMRGIRYINIPTTLISQVDSSIGGKVGYNFSNVKNAVGSFYNPVFVYVSISFLKTLNNVQVISGLGEVIKYGVIKNINLLDFIFKNNKQILELENDKLVYIVRECLKIKSEIIKEDLYDSDERNVLNFGHTAGHAIEVCSKYGMPHGFAVALGMLVSAKISEKKLGLSHEIYEKIYNLCKILNLPTKYNIDNYQAFMYAIKHDKKNDSSIRFVLIDDIESTKIKVSITEKEIIEAVRESIDIK